MCDINTAVQFMIDIANDDTHGYDQKHRNTLDYDCSSLVGTALHNGGFNVSPKSWTGNLELQLRKCGFTDCNPPWKAGDIHLKVGKHVVMSINPKQIVHASINEKGKTTGGETGDQTGKEICIRNYYEYKGGWDFHLRYDGKTENPYIVGKTYTIVVNNLNVRDTPNGKNKAKEELTQDAKKHCNKKGQLMKNTRVTCKYVKVVDNETWMRIPSGWVCATCKGKVYIK